MITCLGCEDRIFAGGLYPDDAEARIANQQLILWGEGQPGAKPAHGRDEPGFSIAGDSIDLACFAACPQISGTVKGHTFRVINGGRKNLEGADRKFRLHFKRQEPL